MGTAHSSAYGNNKTSGLDFANLVPTPRLPALLTRPLHTLYRLQAVVRALRAKRGSRRRPTVATTSSDAENSQNSDALGEKNKDDPASLARARADEAGAILTGLRGGLVLRDEVVAAAEAGELHRGTGSNVSTAHVDERAFRV